MSKTHSNIANIKKKTGALYTYMKFIPLDYAPSNTPISVIKTLKFEKKKVLNSVPFPRWATWQTSEVPLQLKLGSFQNFLKLRSTLKYIRGGQIRPHVIKASLVQDIELRNYPWKFLMFSHGLDRYIYQFFIMNEHLTNQCGPAS